MGETTNLNWWSPDFSHQQYGTSTRSWYLHPNSWMWPQNSRTKKLHWWSTKKDPTTVAFYLWSSAWRTKSCRTWGSLKRMCPISMGGSGWWFWKFLQDTHPVNTPLYWIKQVAMIVGKTGNASQAAWAASRFCSLSCALPLQISSCNCCFLPSWKRKKWAKLQFSPRKGCDPGGLRPVPFHSQAL